MSFSAPPCPGIYYRDKFGVATNDMEFFATVKQAYVEALQWILLYYYRGVSKHCRASFMLSCCRVSGWVGVPVTLHRWADISSAVSGRV